MPDFERKAMTTRYRIVEIISDELTWAADSQNPLLEIDIRLAAECIRQQAQQIRKLEQALSQSAISEADLEMDRTSAQWLRVFAAGLKERGHDEADLRRIWEIAGYLAKRGGVPPKTR